MKRMRSPSSSTTLASSAGVSPDARPTPEASSVKATVGWACAAAAKRNSTLVGKGQDAVVYERVEGLRNRQRLTSLDRGADSLQHTDDLERVERVAARGVVHLRGERPRQHGAEMALDDAVQRPCVERPHRQLGKAVRGKRPS